MTKSTFGGLCRQWRHARRLSQLELALLADISQRHLSWLETGRSQPSRDMVLRLCDALQVPLRERNLLLESAGYVAGFRESRLDDPSMAPVMQALNHLLTHHEPLPALAVNRYWDILHSNTAAARLLQYGRTAAMVGDEPSNLAWLSLHPRGLRPLIRNWPAASREFRRRLRAQMAVDADPQLQHQFAHYLAIVGDEDEDPEPSSPQLPVLPLELEIKGQVLKLFTVIATFGTPQDITTDELRIECFYPTDEVTRHFFEQLAAD